MTGDDIAARVDERIRRRGVVSRILPPPVKITRTVALGLVWRQPRRNELTFRSTGPNGMPATKPSWFVGGAEAGGHAVDIVALVISAFWQPTFFG